MKVKSTLERLVAGAAVVALIAAIEAASGVARSDPEPPEPPGPLEPGNTGAPAELKQCGECHMVFNSGMLPSRSWPRFYRPSTIILAKTLRSRRRTWTSSAIS